MNLHSLEFPIPPFLKTVSFAIALSVATISAAPISWQSAADTTDPSVVLTSGVLVEAVSANQTSGTVTINGVGFTPDDSLLPDSAANVALSGEETLDPGLDAMLNWVDYGRGTSVSLSVGGELSSSSRAISFRSFTRTCARDA